MVADMAEAATVGASETEITEEDMVTTAADTETIMVMVVGTAITVMVVVMAAGTNDPTPSSYSGVRALGNTPAPQPPKAARCRAYVLHALAHYLSFVLRHSNVEKRGRKRICMINEVFYLYYSSLCISTNFCEESISSDFHNEVTVFHCV